jgi:hypothetical protein
MESAPAAGFLGARPAASHLNVPLLVELRPPAGVDEARTDGRRGGGVGCVVRLTVARAKQRWVSRIELTSAATRGIGRRFGEIPRTGASGSSDSTGVQDGAAAWRDGESPNRPGGERDWEGRVNWRKRGEEGRER